MIEFPLSKSIARETIFSQKMKKLGDRFKFFKNSAHRLDDCIVERRFQMILSTAELSVDLGLLNAIAISFAFTMYIRHSTIEVESFFHMDVPLISVQVCHECFLWFSAF